MAIGSITILAAVTAALVQHDLKRLLSYHAVSQVGYMILGIGTGTMIGVAGALFHMLNHAVYKSCLFLGAGNVEKQTGTTDLDKLGGLAVKMPLTFVAFLIASLSIAGIPPFNGFASKWMIYQSIIETGTHGGIGAHLWVVWLTVAMLGSALTLASFIKVLHACFLRKPQHEYTGKEVGITMWLPVSILAFLCVVFGVFAFRIPLTHFVFPAIGKTVALTGTWWAGPATVMIIVAIVIGAIIYLISSAKSTRVMPTYIGGEVINPADDVEVSGTDFYTTIQNMQPFKLFYALLKRKVFDIYHVAGGIVFYCSAILRKAHTGIISNYLTWTLAGFLIVVGVLLISQVR